MLKKHVRLIVYSLVIIKIFFGIAIADPPAFVAGEHYTILRTTGITNLSFDKSSPENSQSKITSNPQVIMFFNYGCYGCWRVNKDFTAWRLTHNKAIDIYYYPVAFNDIWESFAKFYYVNKELQPNDDSEDIFVGIHSDHKKLWLESEMINFYSKKNISKERFLNIYHSFDIERKVKKSMEIAKMYDVHVTPNIVVNVKNMSYMINFTMVQNIETLFKVIDYLIKENPSS